MAIELTNREIGEELYRLEQLRHEQWRHFTDNEIFLINTLRIVHRARTGTEPVATPPELPYLYTPIEDEDELLDARIKRNGYAWEEGLDDILSSDPDDITEPIDDSDPNDNLWVSFFMTKHSPSSFPLVLLTWNAIYIALHLFYA